MDDSRDEISNSDQDLIAKFIALTPRQKELLNLFSSGYTNKQAANQLHVSIRTVECHKSILKGKIGAVDRKDLIEFARKVDFLSKETDR